MTTSSPIVYVTRPDVPQIGLDILKNECEVKTWTQETPVPREELLKNVAGVSGLFCNLADKIDKEVLIQAGDSLKVIATMSVGYEHIDLEECKTRNIRVGYTPDVLTDATAELTLGLLLCTSRRLIEANKEAHNGGWKAWAPSWMCGPGIKGSTVGIVGFGRIGQQLGRILKPFEPANLIFYNRSQKPKEAEDVGAIQVTFQHLIRESDFIICCCALTPETKLMFNESVFKIMKPNAIFINTSRGGVVNQVDLINALTNKTIQAAGLDVTTPEPLPLDSPLFKLPNCVVLPHIGSAGNETRMQMSKITALNILGGLKNEKMISEIL